MQMSSRISKALLAIRREHPFFGALSLFADISFKSGIETASTDGRHIWLGSDFCGQLDDDTFAGIILHELLHCALEHASRRGTKDSYIWNIAADIVVNGIITDESEFPLPDGAIKDDVLKHLSTEAVYEKIEKIKDQYPKNLMIDLSEYHSEGVLGNQQRKALNEYWESARRSAAAIARRYMNQPGWRPGNQLRQLMELGEPQLNWQSILWQKLSRVPCDFVGYDHRFISQGRYADLLSATSTDIHVVVDTSGSIDVDILSEFLSEVSGIAGAYPSLNVLLYYCDVDLHGPYPINGHDGNVPPIGGGGTSFKAIFRRLKNEPEDAVCVYLTDGYGEFPDDEPEQQTVWVVARRGSDAASFPFGEVIRME